MEPSKETTIKLLELTSRTGYKLEQHNGQRRYGPPPDWSGPPPKRGCEVFVGKLPREIYEDELVPLFSTAGKLYDMRLMMDFSGSNRGYAFVTYTNRNDAATAIRQLNGYNIRPGRSIGVVKSVDNCRLFIGGIPKNKTKEEVTAELTKHVEGIVDVIIYKNCYDKRMNRGFGFVEFISHRAAAMARRQLVPGYFKLFDGDVMVDWAEPEPDVDEEQMKKVKVLYARNFDIRTSSETIKKTIESSIQHRVERVKKIYDYAFIHFYEREHAELALMRLQNMEIDGVTIELKWAKPVNRDLYRMQKQNKGNSKFNNQKGDSIAHTLLMYKNHINEREFANTPKDEGISLECPGFSSCDSPTDLKAFNYKQNSNANSNSNEQSSLVTKMLEELCRKCGWGGPQYMLQRVTDNWTCTVRVGGATLTSRPMTTRATAMEDAATQGVQYVWALNTEQQRTSTPVNYYTPTHLLNPYYPYDTYYNIMSRPNPTPVPIIPYKWV